MAKKAKDPDKDKFFWQSLYVRTIPAVDAELKMALAMAQLTDLRLPESPGKLTQEAFLNALFVWANHVTKTRGVRGLEAELRQPFEDMARMVAVDMKEQEALAKERDGIPA